MFNTTDCITNSANFTITDPYHGFYSAPLWIIFWCVLFFTVQIGGNFFLIVMMSYEKYGLELSKRNVANQLAYQCCATLVVGNVFLLTANITRLLFGPLPHAFGFVACGINICLCNAELLYMVEHGVFRCLDLFRWSLTTSSFDGLIAMIVGISNFLLGAVGALISLLSGEYSSNVLYLMYVDTKGVRPCHYQDAVFLISIVAPAILLSVVNVICAICVIINKRNMPTTDLDSDTETFRKDQNGSSSYLLSNVEAQVFGLNLVFLVVLHVLFQKLLFGFNFYWFAAISAFYHLPKTFFLPFTFFVSDEKRWSYFKVFVKT